MIKFLKIYGTNFNSYKEFDLDVITGKNLIVGENLGQESSSNGSGKSSIMESLVYCLYKKYDRGNDPSRSGKGECFVGCIFQIGDQVYTVERFYKSKEHGNSSRIFVGGREISARLSSSTDEEILKIIQIPYELFISTCVVLQGLPVNFSQLTASTRKNILEDILQFSIWDEYRISVSKRIKEVSGSLLTLNPELRFRQDKLLQINAKLESLSVQTGGTEDLLKNQLRESKERMLLAQSRVINLTDGVEEDGVRELSDSFLKKISHFRGKDISLRSEIAKGVKALTEKICVSCNTPFPLEMLETQRIEVTKKKKELFECQNLLEVFTEGFKRCSLMGQQIVDKKSEIMGAAREIESVKRSIEQLNLKTSEEKSKMESSKDVLLVELNQVNDSVQLLNTEQENLKFLDSLLLPSSQFRTNVLVNYIDQINQILKVVSSTVASSMSVSLTINSKATGIELVVEKDGRDIDYKQLSGGEKRRIDVSIILAFQRFLMESSGIKTNLLSLDEIFDALDRQGVDGVINALDMLFGESMAIYVISHNDEIKSRFDGVVRVVKQDGISRIGV